MNSVIVTGSISGNLIAFNPGYVIRIHSDNEQTIVDLVGGAMVGCEESVECVAALCEMSDVD